jgi:hypothetical protein
MLTCCRPGADASEVSMRMAFVHEGLLTGPAPEDARLPEGAGDGGGGDGLQQQTRQRQLLSDDMSMRPTMLCTRQPSERHRATGIGGSCAYGGDGGGGDGGEGGGGCMIRNSVSLLLHMTAMMRTTWLQYTLRSWQSHF